MIDLDWPKNADKVFVRFFSKGREIESKWVESRPTTEPRKTVKDAVDYYDGVWPNDDFTTIWCSGEGFHLGGRVTPMTICTREGFEQEVARRVGGPNEYALKIRDWPEQRWTHTDSCEDKCKILVDTPDCDGYLVVLDEHGKYNLSTFENLEPIKPIRTLTRAEAEEELGCIIKD